MQHHRMQIGVLQSCNTRLPVPDPVVGFGCKITILYRCLRHTFFTPGNYRSNSPATIPAKSSETVVPS